MIGADRHRTARASGGSMRRKRKPGRGALALAPLALAACATAEVGPPGSISHALRADPDNGPAMALAPDMVRRTGAILFIRMGLGWQRLVDVGTCAGYATCDRYRVRGMWLGRFVAISHFSGEATTVYLYDMHAGTSHLVGAVPVFGPDGRVFVAADHDEQNESDLLGTAIWDASERGAPRLLQLFPVEQLAFPRIEGWRGRDCVELTGLPGYGTATFDAAAPRITAFAVRDRGVWRMDTNGRPDLCRVRGAAPDVRRQAGTAPR
mgnify:CR=1 FL=1